MVPAHLHFSTGHLWLAPADDVVTVGLTAHAADGLGGIVYVRLPDLGVHLSHGQPCATVESHKTASDLDSPASGLVLTANDAVRDDPSLVNRDPYGTGWLFRLRVTELGAVMTADEYELLMLAPFPDIVCGD